MHRSPSARNRSIFHWSSFTVLILVVAGCGGSSGGSKPVMVSQLVTAAEGGQVAVGSTGASLDIPANSLGAYTTITATAEDPPSAVPNRSTIRGQYFDFGPEGTTFSTPAMLTLPAGSAPPANMAAVISTFDGTSWTDLPTSAAGGSLTAPVAHFSGFAVRLVAVGAVDCSAPPAACGGDITGTWKLKGGCIAETMVGSCTDASNVQYTVTSPNGSAMFNADLTYTANLPIDVTGNVHATAACIAMLGATTCAQVQTQLNGSDDSHFTNLWHAATCTGNATSTGCDCVGMTTDSITSNESGTYTVAATAFTTTKTGDTTGSPVPYCIQGTTLWVQTDSGEYIVFDKQ